MKTHPAEPIVTQDQRLAEPAESVRETENIDRVLAINMSVRVRPDSRRRAYPDVLYSELAVFGVALLREGPAQTGVYVLHHCAGRVQVLEQQKDEGKLIEEVNPQHESPEDLVCVVSMRCRVSAWLDTHLGEV